MGSELFSDQVSIPWRRYFHKAKSSPVVLLILDRNIDLVPMLAHGWTYQALMNDCLDMKLNRVVVVRIPVLIE